MRDVSFMINKLGVGFTIFVFVEEVSLDLLFVRELYLEKIVND
jgi:hypothetical protein